MADIRKFRELPKRYQCLVALAVLLDGIDAATYLENDEHFGERLREVSEILGRLDPDLRMPLLGTLLRQAVGEGG